MLATACYFLSPTVLLSKEFKKDKGGAKPCTQAGGHNEEMYAMGLPWSCCACIPLAVPGDWEMV